MALSSALRDELTERLGVADDCAVGVAIKINDGSMERVDAPDYLSQSPPLTKIGSPTVNEKPRVVFPKRASNMSLASCQFIDVTNSPVSMLIMTLVPRGRVANALRRS